MNWLTVIWSMASAACLTLSLIHALIWARERRQKVHLLFSLTALGAAGQGISELIGLRAQSVAQFEAAMRWGHIPVAMLLISMVWFIYCYFGTGRRWLPIAITAIWGIVLFLNFSSPHSIVFKRITGLREVTTYWGTTFVTALGESNRWRHLGDLATVLIIVFVADASWRAWRGGQRRRAIVVGGSTLFFLLAAGVHTALVDAGIVHTPYMISLCFLAIVMAMGYELGADVLKATALAQEVTANEQRWRLLLENVQLIVVGLDPDGRVNYVNPHFLKLTGFARQNVMGRNWFENFLPSDEQATLRALFQSALQRGVPPHYQNRILTQTGGELVIQWSNVGLQNSLGEVIGTLSVGADITDRLRAQADLLRTERELDHLTRTNLLGELASALAHELNQPLGAILANAQAARRFLATNTLDPQELRTILDAIVRDDKRAGEVIHRLRAMLHKGPILRENCDLNEIVGETVEFLNSELLERKTALRTQLAPALPTVEAGRIELQQVLVNLIINAAQAMKELPVKERVIEIETRVANGSVEVSVRDQGKGIPPEMLPGIFDPFFTTKQTGLGMGLAICRRLVEAHGGRIKARNNEQRGARFSIFLPVCVTAIEAKQ